MNKSNYIIINKGKGKVGLEDQEGNIILPCKYDKILDYDDDGYIRFLHKNFYGTIDLQGNEVISLGKGITHLGVFYEGVARAKRNGVWYMCDVNGDAINGNRYTVIDAYRNGQYRAEKIGGVKTILTARGEEIFPPKKEKVFSHEKFLNRLNEDYCCGKKLKFYYRDTNTDSDLTTLYKRGMILRAGEFLEVSDKLHRPVSNTRFLIASCEATSKKHYVEDGDQRIAGYPIHDLYFHYNSVFLVWDIYTLCGVTQITLLHLPSPAMRIVEKYGVDLMKLKPGTGEMTLGHAARTDLETKLCETVHGYSLLPDWQQSMHHLVGYADGKPIPLEPDDRNYNCQSEDPEMYLSYYSTNTPYGRDYYWQEEDYLTEKEE